MSYVRTGGPCGVCEQPIVDGDCACPRFTQYRVYANGVSVSYEDLASFRLAHNLGLIAYERYGERRFNIGSYLHTLKTLIDEAAYNACLGL